MSEEKNPPVIYILHGEDEFAVAQFIANLESKLGDASLLAMNKTVLDGRSFNPDELPAHVSPMPFLSKRRLVILNNPLNRMTTKAAQTNFLNQLAKTPETTALVLVIDHLLSSERDRRDHKLHWLEKWAEEQKERVFVKAFPLPKGPELSRWIQQRAKAKEGQFNLQAAELLASYVDGDPRLADQEIEKLLTYVNFQRPVDAADVELLTADTNEGDIFAFIDALASRDGKQSMRLLQQMLEVQEPMYVFAMIISQFRLMLLARESIDKGGQTSDWAKVLGIHPYRAEKITRLATRLSLQELESTYRYLRKLDEAVKTSAIEWNLALDTLVTGFTSQQGHNWLIH